ncbi:GNAT family N-acetyltransferase [Actinomadura harenae]|uniref:N-acetyltransferase n=1 Tax=Actinomadura harenae TaxID=2483351 RepID=A0A3M2LRW8_9ACTN|nr:GNAT family N-acetyltransferase [Actinomadura harenae]RMI40201.1 N-acetyltransferase [Actinomadura harenae]
MLVQPLRLDAELRLLEPFYAAEFLAHQDRARAHIKPWVGPTFVIDDLDGARGVLERYARDGRRIFGIWLDGVLVGGTMFVSFDTESGVCELGCWLEPSAEGRGLISPVIRRMIDWAFRERGLTRAEWRSLPDNARSIRVAERLGMTRETEELWALSSDDWNPPAPETADLDRVMDAMLAAFDNTGDRTPDLASLRDLFLPQAVIVNNTGPEPAVYDLDAFITPRQKILTDGTLTSFSEWEVAHRTEVTGSIAHRFSDYRKSGIRDGVPFEGSGRKSTQFVQTPTGWRITSLTWTDDPS